MGKEDISYEDLVHFASLPDNQRMSAILHHLRDIEHPTEGKTSEERQKSISDITERAVFLDGEARLIRSAILAKSTQIQEERDKELCEYRKRRRNSNIIIVVVALIAVVLYVIDKSS